ncbi:hypothetical protein WR25_05433 [Diploscapter pachys]|uniref:Uncharacterized protein n=1 Tax=Diploscapter pachys TaxID=2018661 RepID=A0A2A2KK43_9BILA|nr:hypothetical protein WR25_05433 [Diploscapter pachys]
MTSASTRAAPVSLALPPPISQIVPTGSDRPTASISRPSGSTSRVRVGHDGQRHALDRLRQLAEPQVGTVLDQGGGAFQHEATARQMGIGRREDRLGQSIGQQRHVVGIEAQQRGFAGIGQQLRRRFDPCVQHVRADAAFAHQFAHQHHHRGAQLVRDPVTVELVAVGERRGELRHQSRVAVAAFARRSGGSGQTLGITGGMRGFDRIDEGRGFGLGVQRVPPLRRLVPVAIGGAEMLRPDRALVRIVSGRARARIIRCLAAQLALQRRPHVARGEAGHRRRERRLQQLRRGVVARGEAGDEIGRLERHGAAREGVRHNRRRPRPSRSCRPWPGCARW